jgi:hypothetical protein
MRIVARAKAEQEYSTEVQAKRYLNLFHEILHQPSLNQSLLQPITYSTK